MAWMTAGEKPSAAKMNETAPGVATATGRLIVTDGANSVAERVPTQSIVATSETTASTSYTDLATSGPAVTVTTGTAAIVIISAKMSNNGAGNASVMNYAVSGATTVAAADDNRILQYESSVADDALEMSKVYLHSSLTAGSNTFTAKYKVSAGTGTFIRRSILVIPL